MVKSSSLSTLVITTVLAAAVNADPTEYWPSFFVQKVSDDSGNTQRSLMEDITIDNKERALLDEIESESRPKWKRGKGASVSSGKASSVKPSSGKPNTGKPNTGKPNGGTSSPPASSPNAWGPSTNNPGSGGKPNTGASNPSAWGPPANNPGNTNPNTGGNTNPSTGGNNNPSTGGNNNPSTGGNNNPSTGGNNNPSTGGNTNQGNTNQGNTNQGNTNQGNTNQGNTNQGNTNPNNGGNNDNNNGGGKSGILAGWAGKIGSQVADNYFPAAINAVINQSIAQAFAQAQSAKSGSSDGSGDGSGASRDGVFAYNNDDGWNGLDLHSDPAAAVELKGKDDKMMDQFSFNLPNDRSIRLDGYVDTQYHWKVYVAGGNGDQVGTCWSDGDAIQAVDNSDITRVVRCQVTV